MDTTNKKDELTFEEEVQALIDEMHIESHAAGVIYENRPEVYQKTSVMPLAYGEAFGASNAMQQYADKLQAILIKSGPEGLAAFNSSKSLKEEKAE